MSTHLRKSPHFSFEDCGDFACWDSPKPLLNREEAQTIADKPITEITNGIMRLDTGQTAFDMQQIENRRFMYQPQTGTLILGYQYKGSGVVSSHADEHHKSGATEPYDSFIRGWIGTGKRYPSGVIHFAPHIPPDNIEAFDRAFSTLQMFSENSANGDTVIRGFGSQWEQPLNNIIEERKREIMSYSAYDHDKLEAAENMRIERRIYFETDKADISALAGLPLTQLQTMREESEAAEQAVFEDLQKRAAAWEEQAGKTLEIKKAIEYVRTPPVKHTSNEWEQRDTDYFVRSNSVYRMYYRINENTRYDSQKQASVPYSWTLTWSIHTNGPDGQQRAKIAGQTRKVFADKADMEKYLNGRIKAYQHLFTELSPPVPQQYADHFKVSGHLLPGYTIEGQEPEQTQLPQQDNEQPESPVQEQQPEAAASQSAAQPERPAPEQQPQAQPEQAAQEAAAAEPRPVVPILFASKDPAEKMKEITERLEQGIQGVFESERYRDYLNTMSKFHHYSFNNTMLIALQGGQFVRGYNKWKTDFDRHVKAEENGIKILAPAPYKVKQNVRKIDPETKKPVLDRDGKPVMEEKEITVPSYKVVSVFDVSQTEGKEMPPLTLAQPLIADVAQYEDFFKAIEKAAPFPISFEPLDGERKGGCLYDERRIVINEGMSQLQNVKTAIHEAAHAKLHDIGSDFFSEDTQDRPDRRTREVQAESIAYAVCQNFGLDVSDYSFAYLADWSSGKELTELKSSLETIHQTAKELITEIEEHFTELQKAREAAEPQRDEAAPEVAPDAPVFSNLPPEQQQALSDTVNATLQTLIEADQRLYGDVTDSTLEAIAVQGYSYRDGKLEKLTAAEPEQAAQEAAAAEPEQADSFTIYQLKGGDETRDYRFEPYDRLQAVGLAVDPANYEQTYTAPLESGMTLESIFERFNIDRPADFTGHSLSVSDVVVLHQNGQDTAHYVDSIGYKEVPEFLKVPEKEITPDDALTGEAIRTPRGTFRVTDMTKEQIEAAGYGFHHQSDDGKYLIMADGTRAFAISAEPPQRENPLQAAEQTTEQNENMIDGIINNTPPEAAALAADTPTYYHINEAAARHANDMNSYRDYRQGSATAEYRQAVDEAAAIAKRQKERVDPMYHDKIDSLLDTYARKLADNMNKSFAIEGRVASILVAGGSNFPVRKKEKQNAARDRNMEEWRDIQGLLDKIRSTGMGGISADDPQAVQKLEKKLAGLEQLQEKMKAVNAYYRKHKTLDGCPHLSPESIEKVKAGMSNGWRVDDKPYPSWALTNNNAEIRRVKERITALTQRSETPFVGWEFDGGKVEANRQDNRLQIFFDGKPDADTRSELKSSGFRWSPSEKAWQRQLNDNAIYAADGLKCIRPITGERPTEIQRKARAAAKEQKPSVRAQLAAAKEQAQEQPKKQPDKSKSKEMEV